MRELVALVARVAELERRFSGMMRHGTVDQVDPAKQRVRLNFGKDEDGNPFLSPWIPYAQLAGALKVHTPPSKGQQFSSLSPNGDWQQAVALPMTWSNQNASPSNAGDENVLTFGNVRATIKNDQCKIVVGSATFEISGSKVEAKVGGVTMNVSGEGVTITGGRTTHDGKNIGSSHIHGGVMPGGATTDVPAN